MCLTLAQSTCRCACPPCNSFSYRMHLLWYILSEIQPYDVHALSVYCLSHAFLHMWCWGTTNPTETCYTPLAHPLIFLGLEAKSNAYHLASVVDLTPAASANVCRCLAWYRCVAWGFKNGSYLRGVTQLDNAISYASSEQVRWVAVKPIMEFGCCGHGWAGLI